MHEPGARVSLGVRLGADDIADGRVVTDKNVEVGAPVPRTPNLCGLRPDHLRVVTTHLAFHARHRLVRVIGFLVVPRLNQ